MKVRNLVSHALENFDTITVDEAMRAIDKVIIEVNSAFSGFDNRLVVYKPNIYQNGYETKEGVVTTINSVDVTELEERHHFNVFSEGINEITKGIEGVSIDGVYSSIIDRIDADNIVIFGFGLTEDLGRKLVFVRLPEVITIKLHGNEKFVTAIFANNQMIPYFEIFNPKSPYSHYTMDSLDEVKVRFAGEIRDLDIFGKFVFNRPDSLDSEINVPIAYEHILYSGLSYHLYRTPRFRDAEALQSYQSIYYLALNELNIDANMHSINAEKTNWDYATARKY